MTPASQRTAEQIREEIRSERAQLGASIAALTADARRWGTIAASLLTAVSGILLLGRMIRRRTR